MEKGYKKQHYIPCLYLSEFVIQSEDNLAIKNPRKRFINALFKDGDVKRIPIESQGFGTFHFSKMDREKKEKAINETETDYKRVLTKFLSQSENSKGLKKSEILTLFTFLHQIHFGNPFYTIEKSDERFGIWNSTTMDFIGKVLLGISAPSSFSKDKYFKQILDKAFEEFHFTILQREPKSDPFITSDNPSVIFSDTSKGGIVSLGLLPLTPDYVFAYCRKKSGTFISHQLSNRDVGRINSVQVFSCRNAIYSNEEFEASDIKAFEKIKQNSKFSLGGFQTNYSYETRFFEADISSLDIISTPRENRITILINGHPNSGKSTTRSALRKKLPKELEFYEFDYDKNFQKSMNSLGKPSTNTFQETKNKILIGLVDASSKVNVISDVLLSTDALLRFSTNVKNTGAKAILIRLFCDKTTRLKRDKKRKRKDSTLLHGFNDDLNPKPSFFYDLEIDTSTKSVNTVCEEILSEIKKYF